MSGDEGQHRLGRVVGQRPAVEAGEPVGRGRPDQVGQHVGEQLPGHGLAVALRVVGRPAGRDHGGDLVGDVLPSAPKSSDGCRVLAGSEKSVSSGQKIGHIIGCPARLICRQPPASVASFVAHQTPMRAPGRSCGCSWETSSTIVSTVVPAKLFCALARPPRRQVRRRPVLHRAVDDGEQRQVDVERVGDASGPDPGAAAAGRLTGPALQHELAGGGVVARGVAGQRMQPQGLLAVGVRFAEGHPVGEGFSLCCSREPYLGAELSRCSTSRTSAFSMVMRRRLTASR